VQIAARPGKATETQNQVALAIASALDNEDIQTSFKDTINTEAEKTALGKAAFKLEHELINKLPKIEILYLAGLFHDLGKGKGGDHSEIGAQTSKIFARKIGLSIADANLISWLVLNHLQMSSISQKKDISDPETIKSFAEIVLNSERLDYLYLLTVNDIRATNPALWNGWKHGLLKDLFLLTRSRLNKEPIKTSEEITKDRKKSVLEFFDISLKEDINEYLQLFDDSYFNKNTSDKLKWQSSLVLKDKSNLTVGCRKCFNNLVEVFVKVENSEGLFLKLVKVLESSGLEIIDASIFTSSNKKIAANTFITKFSHHNRSLNINECKEVAIRIKENFNNYSVLKTKPLARKEISKSFKKSTSITSIEEPQKGKNLLTIETSDSPGLLGRIAQVFKDNDVSIYSARINTLGDSVEDTFEIEDTTSSLVSSKKINKISRVLKETI
jgi:[protein-PII] uridylyltransferase